MCRLIPANNFSNNVQKLWEPIPLRSSETFNLFDEYGKITIDSFNTGYGITYSSFIANFYNDTMIEGNSSSDRSILCFNMGHEIYMENSTKSEIIKLDSNKYWIGKEYQKHSSFDKYEKNKQYIFLCISFDDNFFNNLIKNNNILNNKNYNIKSSYFSSNFDAQITNKQKDILKDILKMEKSKDKLSEIYMESKILELIHITLNESCCIKTIPKKPIYLSPNDMKSLKQAKSILLDDIVNPPSLKVLARKVAINEFKLKEGFKKLFGNTVYGFLQEYRLNEAKKLLELDDINVSEAAHIVGYKSTSHFSKIFKEYFGINAIEVRKQGIKYSL